MLLREPERLFEQRMLRVVAAFVPSLILVTWEISYRLKPCNACAP